MKTKLILALLLIFNAEQNMFGNEEQDKAWQEKQVVKICNELKNGSENLMWFGSDLNLEFTLKGLSKEQSDEYLKLGLEKAEKIFNSSSDLSTCGIVAFDVAFYYYYENINYKKSLYFALKGAENGIPECMNLIRDAYINGNGVIQDLTEAVKWLYLASSLGNEESKNQLNALLYKFREDPKARLDEGSKRAKIWMKSHPRVFFLPD